MNSNQPYRHDDVPHDAAYEEDEKKGRLVKKFLHDLTSWAGTSVVLVAMDLFLSGSLTWSKYPVFFYGIYIVMQLFRMIRIRHFGIDFKEKRRSNRRTHHSSGRTDTGSSDQQPIEDYSEELLHQEDQELADLKEYRKLGKPWKDDDLV